MNVARQTSVDSDSAAVTGPGMLVGVVLAAGSGADATLILYDNTSAATPILCTLAAAQKTSASFTPSVPIAFSKGVYADIGGSGAVATVVYL